MFSIQICLELVVYYLVLVFLNNISLTFVSKKKKTSYCKQKKKKKTHKPFDGTIHLHCQSINGLQNNFNCSRMLWKLKQDHSRLQKYEKRDCVLV